MDDLIVPEPFAGPQVERQQTIAEQVGALAVRPVQIEGRRTERKITDAALLVDGDLAPRVGSAGRLPGVGRPRLVSELAGTRNRVEGPLRLTGDHIEGAQVTGRRAIALP